MFSASTLMFLFCSLVGVYIVWRLLKAVALLGSIALVGGALIFLWAYTGEEIPTSSATPAPTQVSQETQLVQQGARLVAKPVREAAQKIVDLTLDEEAFAREVGDAALGMHNIVDLARSFAQGDPEKGLAKAPKTP